MVTSRGLLDRLREIRPLLQAEASEGEAHRQPTQRALQLLDQQDIWRRLLPIRWGGAGLSVSAFAEIQIELARGDPALAWLSHIINGTSWAATLMPEPVPGTLFAEGRTRVAGAYNPPGRARRVEGGYRVSGAFPYASGCRQADWFLCSAIADGENGGKPLIFYAAMADGRIEDSWFVTGLQGTGSDTCVFDEAFVPDARVVAAMPASEDRPRRDQDNNASDHWPLVATVRTLCAAVLIGAAEEMLHLAGEDAHRRGIVTTSYASKTQSPVFQHHYGEATARIATARLVVEDGSRRIDGWAARRENYPLAEAAANKGRIALAAQLVTTAVDQLMTITGSHAYALSHPMQRYWRDIHMAAGHVTLLPHVGYEIYGRDLLDVAPNITPPGGF